jgi:PHP family Zn ribbon phosphoesterase
MRQRPSIVDPDEEVSIYNRFIEKFGNEYSVLIDASKEDLGIVVSPEIAEAIIRVREGNVQVIPGYNGVYGQLVLSKERLKDKNLTKRIQQLNIFDFQNGKS